MSCAQSIRWWFIVCLLLCGREPASALAILENRDSCVVSYASVGNEKDLSLDLIQDLSPQFSDGFLGFVDGPNLYAYVKQNPWTGFDPEGLAEFENADGSGARWSTDSSGYTHVLRSTSSDSIAPTSAHAAAAEVLANGHNSEHATRALERFSIEVPPHQGWNDDCASKIFRHVLNPESSNMEAQALVLSLDQLGNRGGVSSSRAQGSLKRYSNGAKIEVSAKDVTAETNATTSSGGQGDRYVRPGYSEIPDHPSVGPGKDFTDSKKQKFIEMNRDANGGVVRSDKSGKVLDPATQSKAGVTPSPNEVNVDHIKAKANGGSNSSTNVQILGRDENIEKSNK